MTTVREIINVARAKSLKNNLEEVIIAREETELLEVVNRAMNGLWMFASAINPSFFAAFKSVTSTFVSSSIPSYWLRPVEAVQVFYLEITREESMVQVPYEVVRVPIDRKNLEPDQPAVYLWGKRYYSAGNPLDPVAHDGTDPGEPITFYFSVLPTEVGDIDAELDPLWEPQFDELLALEVAIYLAVKDERGGETEAMVGARNAWADRFAVFLEHSDTGLIDSFTPRRTSAEQVASLRSLLAGGAG